MQEGSLSPCVGQKCMLGFEIWRHMAANISVCPQTDNRPISEDSSSILTTRNKPCIPTLYDPLFLPSAPPSDEVFIPAEDWKMRGRSSSLNSLSRVGPLVGASREEY